VPRAERVYYDGAVYHVYNRLGRGERVFAEAEEADRFVELLRDVMDRDGVTVFAWALMPTHYHLALQAGPVSVDRPIKSLQQRTTRAYNARCKVYGPLWQGRYRAKLIEGQRYLDQLVAYIHINPVEAGLVEDPAKFKWSGHAEILGKKAGPVVDVEEVLRLFGKTRRGARAAYARALRGARETEWIGEDPGRLPWWRLGRPPRAENEDPNESGRSRCNEAKRRRMREHPELGVEEYLRRGAEVLGVDMERLASRRRTAEIVRAREALAVVGVERYGLRVKDFAHALGKHPVTATTWVMRGTARRREDRGFAKQMDRLDRLLAGTDLLKH
jgi:putative transposase